MLSSNMHAYFTSIELDPSLGWEITEMMFDTQDDVHNIDELRAALAQAVSHFIQMDADEDTDQRYSFMNAIKLLRSKLPLTYVEQRTILGEAVWWNTNDYRAVKELLHGRAVLSPSQA